MNREKMRQLRQEKGYSLRQFAKLTGFSKTWLHELETGTATNPTINTIKRIAEVLDIDYKELLEE